MTDLERKKPLHLNVFVDATAFCILYSRFAKVCKSLCLFVFVRDDRRSYEINMIYYLRLLLPRAITSAGMISVSQMFPPSSFSFWAKSK